VIRHPACIETHLLGRNGGPCQAPRVERVAIIREDHPEMKTTHDERLIVASTRELR
jgi:hypothetical protein